MRGTRNKSLFRDRDRDWVSGRDMGPGLDETRDFRIFKSNFKYKLTCSMNLENQEYRQNKMVWAIEFQFF